MSKLRVFEIQLDNTEGVFFSGQFVSGTVIIELSESMKVRSVCIRLNGGASVSWEENYETSVLGSETYVDTKLVLWGHPPEYSGDTPALPAGTHKFPFKLPIPDNCPSSFESQCGNIRYSLKVTLDKPWKFDLTAKCAFTVVRIVDLNRMPQYAVPVKAVAHKRFTFSRKEISGTITLPKVGFAAGEFVPVDIQLTDNSAGEIEEIKLKLIQLVEYRAQNLSKRYQTTLAKIRVPSGQLQYHTDSLQLPAVPPILQTCSIIDISYSVYAEFVTHGMSNNFGVWCALIIGSVPLRRDFNRMRTQPTAPLTTKTQLSALPMFPPIISKDYPDLPPPSYEQSVFGLTNIRDKDDNTHTRGQLEFAPRYPYYGRRQTEAELAKVRAELTKARKEPSSSK